MVVIVRQRGDRSRASGYAWISANPTDSEEMIDVADTQEHRLQIEDSGFKLVVPPWFQLRRGRRSRILGGSRQERQRAHNETKRLSEGVLGKD